MPTTSDSDNDGVFDHLDNCNDDNITLESQYGTASSTITIQNLINFKAQKLTQTQDEIKQLEDSINSGDNANIDELANKVEFMRLNTAYLICVPPKTYPESIVFPLQNQYNKPITLECTNQKQGHCVLDGTGKEDSVVTFKGGADKAGRLFGFTIKKGDGKEEDITYKTTADNCTTDKGTFTPALASAQGTCIIKQTRGGGIYVGQHANPVLSNLYVTHNTATLGGGLYIADNSRPVLNNITVNSNNAHRGGGFYLRHNASPMLLNVTVDNNTAGEGATTGEGAGFFITQDSSPKLMNVLIHANNATGAGGGVMISHNSHPRFYHVTVAHNIAPASAGVHLTEGSSLKANNSIIWHPNNNSEIQISSTKKAHYDNAKLTIKDSIISKARVSLTGEESQRLSTFVTYGDVIEDDPKFVVQPLTFHLRDSSPAIGASNDNTLIYLNPKQGKFLCAHLAQMTWDESKETCKLTRDRDGNLRANPHNMGAF